VVTDQPRARAEIGEQPACVGGRSHGA
jgi:hypothetical protein